MNRTIGIFLVMLASCVTSFAQQPTATGKPSIESGDPSLLPDQEIGRRFLVKPNDLPAPPEGLLVTSGHVRAGARLTKL